MLKHRIYALYKGEQNLADGTLAEIAKKTGKTESYLRWMTYPSYQKRKTSGTLQIVYIGEEKA
jgi:hypothetical protein